MTRHSQRLGFTLVLLIAAAGMGCGDSTHVVPGAPSAIPSPSVSGPVTSQGATINGVVTTGSSAASVNRATSTTTIVVTVVGTTISSPVDSAGRFQLTGVPTGDAVLHFSGSTADARLTIAAVGESERIEITVSVAGTAAIVITIQRETGDNKTELEGKVSAFSGSCPNVTMTVNGTSVTTNASTQFSGAACSALVMGAKVEVKGTRQPNGSILASRVKVELEEAEIEGKVSALSGSCPTVTMTVNGTSVTTNASTQFSGGACSAIVKGAKVEIKGTRQPNGSILASRVKVPIEQAEIEGKVSALSGSCPALTLMVNATSVITNAATQFSGGSCQKIVVGRKIEAKGTRQPNGSVLATRIELDD